MASPLQALVAVSLLVMIVDRARAATSDRSDRRSRSTACKPADRSAARRAYAHTLYGLANVMVATVHGVMVVMVIMLIVDRRGGSRN